MALTSMILHTDVFVMTFLLVSTFLFLLLQVAEIGLWIGGTVWNSIERFYFPLSGLSQFPNVVNVLTFFLFKNSNSNSHGAHRALSNHVAHPADPPH
jgi:hypothetical protein